MPGSEISPRNLKNIRLFSWLIIIALISLSCSYLFPDTAPDTEGRENPPQAAATDTSQPPPPAAVTPPESTEVGSDPRKEWPLVTGNYWTYEVAVYSEILTATYLVTDTVVAVQSQEEVLLAQVNREEKFVAGDPAVQQSWYEEPVRWYVVQGNQVYKPRNDTFANIEQSWLEFVFPLSENCWHPSYESRAQPGMVDCSKHGSEYENTTVPAGTFTDCALVLEQYLSGSVITTFCSGIGIVAEDYDHIGSPFGYHARLSAFKVSSP